MGSVDGSDRVLHSHGYLPWHAAEFHARCSEQVSEQAAFSTFADGPARGLPESAKLKLLVHVQIWLYNLIQLYTVL
jgi:hypothetical protein